VNIKTVLCSSNAGMETSVPVEMLHWHWHWHRQ